MKSIYEPTGRALEYSLLALNLYRGCSHGCDYCFAPGVQRRTAEKFHADTEPRAGIIEQLRKDAPNFAGTDKRVLLCFTSDPYQPSEAEHHVTRQALEILREHDIPWQVLTKGGMRAARDFCFYSKQDAFATTLTYSWLRGSHLNGTWRTREPGAASPYSRYEAIREAKQRGIETWVSLEPVLDPKQSLQIINQTHEFVDLYKIGKLNHNKAREAEIDWVYFAIEAIKRCEEYGVPYYVKNDLAAHLSGFTFTNTDTRKVSHGRI